MIKLRRISAAVLAAVTALTMAACGSKKADDSSKATTTKAAETTAAETTADGTAEQAEPEKTVGTYSDGTFDCEYYTVTVDESKWGYSDGSDMDCQFNYIAKPDDDVYSASSLNVASFAEDTMQGVTVEDYAEQIAATYSGEEGYKVSSKEAELDGQKGMEITINFPMGDSRMTIKQLVVQKDGAVIAVSYGALDDIYKKMQKQFDEVIGSIKLK